MGLTDAEFWQYTWREIEALVDAFSKRERRLDQRNAMLRYQMRLCWETDPPSWEEFFPSDDEPGQPADNPDERIMLKLASVMAQTGSTTSAVDPVAQAKADAFREKMWRLMGVTD